MRHNFHIFGAVIVMLVYLSACSPDCKNVTIQKVDWTTRYEDYYIDVDSIQEISEYVDTLVSYSVIEHRTKKEHKKDADGNSIGSKTIHYITIRNNNESYSNRFAVKLIWKKYIESNRTWTDMTYNTDYVSIMPNETYTFSIAHSSWWRNESQGYNEANVSISIIQEPAHVYKTTKEIKRIRQKKVRRLDNLIFSDTVVNDCECDIELLKVKYATIKETFERLQNEKLIRTE